MVLNLLGCHCWRCCAARRGKRVEKEGNGRSGRPPSETITFEQLCADADALRERLGFEEVAVLGYSFGGCIALEYALRYPERLSHLILLDTAPTLDYREEIEANARRKGATQEQLGRLMLRRRTRPSLGACGS